MPRHPETPAAREAALRARLPHVPRAVADRMAAAQREGALGPRGTVVAVERFFARLAETRRPLEAAVEADFAAVAASRTALRTLLAALARFAPDVPLAPAENLRRGWDRWLNARYNVREPRPRRRDRVALPPEAWPEAWRAALPALDRPWRDRSGKRRRPLAPKSRTATVQAVGTVAAARAADPALGEILDIPLVNAALRFLLEERKTSDATVADYLERFAGFAARGRLIAPAADAYLLESVAILREAAAAAEPDKLARLRAFHARFDLGDLLRRAVSLAEEADARPAHLAETSRLRRMSVAFGLLVNGCDRRGDLAALRIGVDILRGEDGAWRTDLRQGKTGRRKSLLLWPAVSALLDAHVLGDRPAWLLARRLAELQGRNLLSLEEQPLHDAWVSRRLSEEFGVSSHLVRTLVTDFLRNNAPDAAWAAQQILGHGSRYAQRAYRTDFREVAAVRKVQQEIGRTFLEA